MQTFKIAQVTRVDTPLVTYAPPTSSAVITKADLNREYVATRLDSLFGMLKTLPTAFDDLTRQFGVDIYENMMRDDEVAASINVLILAATSQDASIIPAVNPDSPDYDMAILIADFIQRCVDNMETPFNTVNEGLLEALWQGSAVSEIQYKVENSGQDAGMVVLKDVKKKPLRNTGFMVDAFNNIVGVVGSQGAGLALPYGSIVPLGDKSIRNLDYVLPRDKFLIFTWNPPAGDPRGRSILAAAYTPWWIKQQNNQLWIEWSAKYAHPSIWATVPEAATGYCDPVTGQTISAVELLASEGKNFANATFAAFAYGTELHMLETKSNGEAFKVLQDAANMAIRRSILNQSLATAEASHNSRAAASVHQDVLGLKIIKIKNMLGEVWRRDVFRMLIAANFGKEFVSLTPKVDLGEGTGFPPSLSEIATILGNNEDGKWQPDEDQWMRLEKRFNLPIRRNAKRNNNGTAFDATDSNIVEGVATPISDDAAHNA